MLVNVEMIQSLQATPDTVITFTTKEKIMVKEPVDEISRRIYQYQCSIHRGTRLNHFVPEESIPDIAA
jgi:flagellar protein FlbD